MRRGFFKGSGVYPWIDGVVNYLDGASINPPAAEHFIAVVKHDGLTGSDCSLRRVELEFGAHGIRLNADFRRGGGVSMTDLRAHPEPIPRSVSANPIHAGGGQTRPSEIVARSHHHLRGLRFDLEDIERLGR
jgi:hypothetical protein